MGSGDSKVFLLIPIWQHSQFYSFKCRISPLWNAIVYGIISLYISVLMLFNVFKCSLYSVPQRKKKKSLVLLMLNESNVWPESGLGRDQMAWWINKEVRVSWSNTYGNDKFRGDSRCLYPKQVCNHNIWQRRLGHYVSKLVPGILFCSLNPSVCFQIFQAFPVKRNKMYKGEVGKKKKSKKNIWRVDLQPWWNVSTPARAEVL